MGLRYSSDVQREITHVRVSDNAYLFQPNNFVGGAAIYSPEGKLKH